MSFLLAIWLLSLAVILGLFFYARHRRGTSVLAPANTTENLNDLFVGELRGISDEVMRGIAHIRPHGARVVLHGSVLIKKGHNMLIEKAFGRIAIEKGKTSSFFLKRIAEHKESLNEKDRQES